MPQGSRPDRVADQIRAEVAALLGRELRDPGLGFVTVTRVQVTPDLQIARIYYTTMGDDRARRRTAEALQRALPFVRRSIGSRLRLRRVPEIQFLFDESIEQHERLERLIQEIHETDALRQAQNVPSSPTFDDAQVDPELAEGPMVRQGSPSTLSDIEGPTVRPDSPSTLSLPNGPGDAARAQAAEDDENH
jgi:ribosome-binding factor A